jgi:hypothetical protein
MSALAPLPLAFSLGKEYNSAGIFPSSIPYFGPKPSFATNITHKQKTSFKNGLRFQRAVEESLRNSEISGKIFSVQSPKNIEIGPWIWYLDARKATRFSQPDILLFYPEEKNITIIECKLSHTRSAYGQYKHYEALIRLMYPEYNVCGIEICRSIDPSEAYIKVVDTLDFHNLDFAAYLWLN